MKKCIIRIAIITVILAMATVINSFASSSYRLRFDNVEKINAGETVEIPLKLDKVDLEGIEKGLLTLKCKITYDEDIFELVPYDKSDDTYIKITDAEIDGVAIGRYITANYVPESKTLVIQFNARQTEKFKNDIGISLNKITKIGTMQLKVKDGVKTGNYNIEVSKIEAANSGDVFEGTCETTLISVEGINEEEEEKVDEKDETNSDMEKNKIEEEQKEVIIKKEISKDGKKVYLIPNEEDGAKIGTIVAEGKKLTRDGDRFVLDSEPDKLYNLYIYGINGKRLTNDYVVTSVSVDSENSDSSNEQKQEQQNENKDEPSDGQADENKEDSSDSQTDENKEGPSNSQTEQNKEEPSNNQVDNKEETKNEGKSPQTGDYVSYTIVVILLCVEILVITGLSKSIFNKKKML